MSRVIRLGTRGSALARWQTDHICGLLRTAWPDLTFEIVVITTRGDRVLDTPLPLIGGKGVFTAELEAALHSGEIDLAVHSLKDLPTDTPPDLTIGAIPERGDPGDILVSRQGYTLDSLPSGAVVGTSSTRRAGQLRFRRPDLRTSDIRGNIDTRIRKALATDSPYDAIVLARAGLERLGIANVTMHALPFEQMLPAPGQGALAVQCRNEESILVLLKPLIHIETLVAVSAERAFLASLGGGCAVPIAAYAHVITPSKLHLQGRICAQDGSSQIDVSAASDTGLSIDSAQQLGADLAHQALEQGAAALINTLSSSS